MARKPADQSVNREDILWAAAEVLRHNGYDATTMSMSGTQAMNYALDNGYTVEEVDALTGPLIGRPKTATFNLNDLVGFDIAVGVARNLYDAIPDDPARDILQHPKNAELSDTMTPTQFRNN